MKGFKVSEDVKRRLREVLKGLPSHAKGKHLSKDTKQKMSEATKGFKVSDDTKKRLSEYMKGKPSHHKKKFKSTLNIASKDIKTGLEDILGDFPYRIKEEASEDMKEAYKSNSGEMKK